MNTATPNEPLVRDKTMLYFYPSFTYLPIPSLAVAVAAVSLVHLLLLLLGSAENTVEHSQGLRVLTVSKLQRHRQSAKILAASDLDWLAELHGADAG